MRRMMNENERYDYVHDRFLKLSDHRYLHDHITRVSIDEDKTYLLINSIQDDNLREEEEVKRVTAGLLVDAALTTHQYVPLHNENEQREKEKQLVVLAGDWYSSLYYSELSKLGDVGLVRVFSRSIQKTNNAKIRLHERGWKDLEELEELITTMEATLIQNVGIYFNQRSIADFAGHFLTYRRLLDLIEHAEQDKEPFGSARLSPLFAIEPTDRDRENYIQEMISNLEVVAANVKDRLLASYQDNEAALSTQLKKRFMELVNK
ncbi:heptaprenyl diphosphate synthase [Geomicrobium sediminis]|uniref:Heptaprenyl diphosphate synthase n=2 Tax=Geomicrobium sediminis TaxID=1347788 RepID=A0ABS2PDY1_9BACL|nr:heptaprenyl diphosphate synthase [Geomicrobium sediminis]